MIFLLVVGGLGYIGGWGRAPAARQARGPSTAARQARGPSASARQGVHILGGGGGNTKKHFFTGIKYIKNT
jgi:hypothetical protein